MAPPQSQGQIVLVRHGETAWSRNGRHTSITDLPLTEHGASQARSLRAFMHTWTFSEIRTSPLVRARQTAELAGLVTPEPIIDDDLFEWRYGDYEGITSAQIHEHNPNWTIFSAPTPGGESISAVEQRVDRVLQRCRAIVDDGSNIALVAHGHVLRVMGARWLACAGTFGAHLGLDAASVSVLGFEHDAPVLHNWNQTIATSMQQSLQAT